MTEKKGLEIITTTTRDLWYKVNEKYGDHVYNLWVNGLSQVGLSKGYMETIAIGTEAVNAKLRELLEAEGGTNDDNRN